MKPEAQKAVRANEMIASGICLMHVPNHVSRSPKLEGPAVSLSISGGPLLRATPRPRPLPKSPLALLGSPLPRARGYDQTLVKETFY